MVQDAEKFKEEDELVKKKIEAKMDSRTTASR